MWEKTQLIRKGVCLRYVCLSRVPSSLVKDPNVPELPCEVFDDPEAEFSKMSNQSMSEFGQDWFLHRNFFRQLAAQQQRLSAEEAAGKGASSLGGTILLAGTSSLFPRSCAVMVSSTNNYQSPILVRL